MGDGMGEAARERGLWKAATGFSGPGRSVKRMAADYLTYRRATSASVLGLLIQGAMAAGLAIYGVLSRDGAAVTASLYCATGMVAWLTLAIVYDQHRRERIEAVEAEAFNKSELAGTSAFDKTEDEFRPAAKRLRMLYRVFVPAMGVLAAAALIGLGYWRASVANAAAYKALHGTGGIPSLHAGWGLGLGVGLAALAFVFARYAATMARQRAWANLRAGAGFAAGSALFSLAIAIGHGVDFAGTSRVAWLIGYAIPIAMIVLGVEVVLNLVLDLYRPRKADETPRPAFDSRVLGFMAAPDRLAQSVSDAIAYQLGFDVSSGWMFQLLRKWVLPLIGVGVLVMWLLTSLAVVQPHQRAVVLRFGRPVGAEIGPGIHLKAPWPVDTIYVPEYVVRDERGRATVRDLTATGLRTIQLATSPPGTTGAILWTNDHLGEEVYQFVRSSSTATQASKLDDLAVVSIEIPLRYVVEDVRLYDELAPAASRDDLLRAVGRREVMKFFKDKTLEQILTGDRVALGRELRSQIEDAYAKLNPGPDGVPRGAGVKVVSVALTGMHPPKPTATSFETVVMADQRREANIAAAKADAARSLTEVVGDVALANSIVKELDALEALRSGNAPQDQVAAQEFKVRERLSAAGGRMSSTLAEAAAARWQRHMGERGRAARFAGQVALSDASPMLYRVDQYYRARLRMMASARVFFVPPDVATRFDLDLKNKDTGLDVFRPKQESPENP